MSPRWGRSRDNEQAKQGIGFGYGNGDEGNEVMHHGHGYSADNYVSIAISTRREAKTIIVMRVDFAYQ